MTTSHGMHKFYQIFFYATEGVYAVISGVAEAYIYKAYLPDTGGPWPWIEATSRATITQLAIILFGIAAVRAAERAGGGWKGFFAVMPINIITLIFSLVAFWFMRESAIVFRQSAMLAGLSGQPLNLPGGISLSSIDFDPTLIAALPFFLVALNWLGPIIVAEPKVESPEDRKARQQAELENMAHSVEMAKLRGKKLRGIAKAAFTKEDGDSLDNSEDSGDRGVEMPDQSSKATLASILDSEIDTVLATKIYNADKPKNLQISERTLRGWCTDKAIDPSESEKKIPATMRTIKGRRQWGIDAEWFKQKYPKSWEAYEKKQLQLKTRRDRRHLHAV